ncbi:hypothetical protein [Polyangium sp. 6x1]|uniref:hypothetical protein n=1 Tax=Polyangium sp. 6x1 TaxID=3042689 RepID=UPI002483069E|nr:hypothetical protein [Polyangium sp. 6x1]MDI1449866.1 hypothetical protein [Polyangium sp. 6x1]
MRLSLNHKLSFFALLLIATGACTSSPSSPNDPGSGGNGGNGGSGGNGGGVVDDAGPGDADPPPNLSCASGDKTAFEKALIEMPADSWATAGEGALAGATATTFSAYCHTVQNPDLKLTSGCDAVVEGWGGAVTDGSRLFAWGGGHNDYGGNEVYVFDPASMTWSLVTQPSKLTAADLGTDPLEDGQPNSRHTYDGLAFLGDKNEILAWGGSTAPLGNSSQRTWRLDLGAAAWHLADPGDTLPAEAAGHFWMGTDYDPATGTVWTVDDLGLLKYSVAEDKWTKVNQNLGKRGGYKRGVFDARRSLFFAFGITYDQVGDPIVNVIDVKTDGGPEVTSEWPLVVPMAQGPGADIVPAEDAIYVWSGGAPLRIALATKTVAPVSADGAPSAACPQGTFGRWRYLKAYNVFILVNRAGEPVHFYKPSAACGPQP